MSAASLAFTFINNSDPGLRRCGQDGCQTPHECRRTREDISGTKEEMGSD